MMIGSANYVGMNVRVWCMCSGSVLYMIALEILSWENYTSCWGEAGLKSLVHLIILIGQALFRV